MTDATPATADAPPASPSARATSKPQQEEGIKLILEQVLVAFILAFIFRAFVLEAFVIPTGSMAPTLLGAHMQFECPDCGWEFTVNYPTDSGQNAVPSHARVAVPVAGGVQTYDRVYAVRCPNCSYRLPRVNPLDPSNDATAPPVSYGDRILVLKHLYLFEDPQRWDVVVFKNPSRNSGDDSAPAWSSEPYQQNYIKRLIGLPGETVMLLDGNVYVTDANKTLAELSPADFRIVRKDAVAQSALWRIVYDDDHRPQGLARDYMTPQGTPAFSDPAWELPWRQTQGAGWTVVPVNGGGGFHFDNVNGGGTLTFDAEANPLQLSLTDYLVYDVTEGDQRTPRERYERRRAPFDTFVRDFAQTFARTAERPNNPAWLSIVSDLRLSLFYQRLEGDGPLTLRLSKRDDVFEAEILPDRVRLTHVGPSGAANIIGEAPLDGPFDTPRRIDLINADYHVRLQVDGKTLLETTEAQYAPDVAALLAAELADEMEPLPTISISADRQQGRIRHVKLWRDVYHTARGQSGQFSPFASPLDFPNSVIRLGEGEFFVLGDNPFLSGDARIWVDGLSLPYEDLLVEGGRVPARFMLGRAFFVYWPASYRPGGPLPALVPNFGDMRFIR